MTILAILAYVIRPLRKRLCNQGKCPLCGRKVIEVTKATIANVSCEESIQCPKHGEIGYWAYGSHDPSGVFK